MKIKVKKMLLIAGVIGGILLLGYFIGRKTTNSGGISPAPATSASSTTPIKKATTVWTCSMHPQIRQPKPGKCPICSMTLIPLKQDTTDDNGNSATLKLSPRALKLAAVQTVPVRRKLVTRSIKMVGMVDYNESLLAYITARMPGRIDTLYVNYTGIPVRKGDHMAEYYSPDLLVAQRELLLAVNNIKKKGDSAFAGYGMSDENILETVKKKLDLWGLTKKNIDNIIDSGKVRDHIVLYSPIAGIVIEKNALEGKYFKTGDRLFTVADLSKVWIFLDAYEQDLMWLRYGQTVKFSTVSYPGVIFTGKISFIDPVLDKKTRTVKIRVDANNSTGKLKPGMFINAIVKATIAKGGKVIDPSLSGKWLCPMHPDIVRDKPGKCPICSMKLVKAASLGYESIKESDKLLPLVIPATAPLITGKRAIVYIKSKSNPGTFYGQEVVLGPRAGDYYIVKSGLKAGELVVTSGNFKIDSSLQIQARPSMMSAPDPIAENSTTTRLKVNKQFRQQLNMIYNSYFALQKSLAADEFKPGLKKIQYLGAMLGHISTSSLNTTAIQVWEKNASEIKAIVAQAKQSKNINSLREDFANLSAVVEQLFEQFGTVGSMKVIKFKCPMAFNNKGAEWLQQKSKIANPYLGKTMPGCGEKVEDIVK